MLCCRHHTDLWVFVIVIGFKNWSFKEIGFTVKLRKTSKENKVQFTLYFEPSLRCEGFCFVYSRMLIVLFEMNKNQNRVYLFVYFNDVLSLTAYWFFLYYTSRKDLIWELDLSPSSDNSAANSHFRRISMLLLDLNARGRPISERSFDISSGKTLSQSSPEERNITSLQPSSDVRAYGAPVSETVFP